MLQQTTSIKYEVKTKLMLLLNMFMWHGSISEKGLKLGFGCIGNGDGVENEIYIPFSQKCVPNI